MSELGTGQDAVRFFLTGGARDGDIQPDPALSLGGFRSCTPIESIGHRAVAALRGIRTLYVSGENGIGEARLAAVGLNELNYTAPDGTPGDRVTILPGETKIISDADENRYIEVSRRLGDEVMAGSQSLILVDMLDNAIGIDEVTSAEAAAGDENYSGIMARAGEAITDLEVWQLPVERLAGQVSDVSQLAASGAGLIRTGGSFKGWPLSSGVYIEDNGGILQEIGYYSTRTDGALGVTAAGRALLGTSASAGSPSDVVFPIALVRIGKETPSSGEIQTIANDGVEPTSPAISWSNGIRNADAISLGDLAAGEVMGLWIERSVIVGHVGTHWSEIRLGFQFVDAGGTTRNGAHSGRYRVANDGLVQWEVFRRIPPAAFNFASPHDTFTSSPHEINDVLANSTKYDYVTRLRNEYNLLTQNIESTRIEIDGAGDELAVRPSAPDEDVFVFDAAGGELNIQTTYVPGVDGDDRADVWVLWITTDGTTPDPDVDGETDTVAMLDANGIEFLDYTSAGLDIVDNTPVQVVVRTRRSGTPDIDSENTDAVTFNTDSAGPTKPLGWPYLDNFGLALQSPATAPSDDFVIDAPNNIRVEIGRGKALFYGDTVLIWAAFFDSGCDDGATWYVPSEFNFVNAVVSGAGGADAIETASWTGGDKRLYVVVNGVRRMEIDVTNLTITADTFALWDETPTTAGADAVWQRFTEICFMVWDSYTEDNVCYLDVDSDGLATSAIPVNQLLTQAEIEAL